MRIPTPGDKTRALKLILNILDAPEWGVSTLDDIAHVMAHLGYQHNDDIDWETWEKQNEAVSGNSDNWKIGETE